ncbi:MAG TPA: serine protease [Ferruginibacter sp.]|nr:serine protease [Ferruginibacter sp.]HMP20221.1 serine protease [Ferruginibacter sp.]
MEYFDQLEPLLKAFWFIAIPVSIIFIIQTIMTFMGADAGDGLEADFDSNLDATDGPFQLFSLRNLINFLLGLSWTGISFYGSIASKPLLILLALVVGLAFVYVFFLVIKQVQKLAEDNSFKITEALHKTADVYLTIPAHKSGKGKIMLSVKGSVRELDAMTEQESIPSGATVKIVRLENKDILIVEKI